MRSMSRTQKWIVTTWKSIGLGIPILSSRCLLLLYIDDVAQL